jgi:predicted phage terminase large subunit-like protein
MAGQPITRARREAAARLAAQKLPTITKADLIAAERELCRRSLAAFAQRAWRVLEPAAELKWGWALDAICLHLEAITSGDITKLLINVPPGSMKSLLVGVIWPAWEWGPKGMSHLRYVGTAHEETLAIRDSRRCRDLIKSDWYQSLWPIDLAADLDGKREFGNTSKGSRQARSFTSMTGVRGDRVIIDDPLSVDSANSPAKLEAARVTFTESLPSRLNSEKSAIVVIMQRLNEADTSGVILSMGLDYVHLCIPMRFEAARRCTTKIGWTDPRTEEGELMFPERFGEEQVAELERTLGSYGAAGQLQQRPAPRGGGIIKTAWFGYWTSVPVLEYRAIFGDTAQKTEEKNDFSVFQCWGRSAVGQAVLLDQIRGKWEAPELLTQARAFWFRHKGGASPAPLRAMYIEDKASGTGLIQTLRREGVPIIPVQRSKDKISRGYDAAPFIESENVLLPQDAGWLSDFLAEVESFPGAAHDDQCDPMFDAIENIQSTPKVVEKQTVVQIPVAHRWR